MTASTKRWILLVAAFVVPLALVALWATSAAARLAASAGAAHEVATASVANDAYCTPQLKAIVRRVAGACGLLEGAGGGRGCQPLQARKVAALSGTDFNALFKPLAQALVEKAWSDQRGASFFFVVSRASPDGDEQYNEALSRDRAKAVLDHLDRT